MLQRGYIILIIGAALLISGLAISAFWAGSFASSFLRQGIILNDVALAPAESGSNTIRVTDISHPIALQVHFESHDSSSGRSGASNSSISSQAGQTPNATTTSNNISLREVVKDPVGKILSQNTFSRQFFTTFRPTTQGTYTLTISNSGSNTVKVGALFGPATFVNENNQINLNLFLGILAGIGLVVIGIIALIAGIIILILDRRKGTKGKESVATR
jgi:hypothetical protein